MRYREIFTEAQEAPPTPYGYWIKADGNFLVVDHEQHQAVLHSLGLGDAYGDNHQAFDLGWVRVVAHYPGRDGFGGDKVEGKKELSIAFSPLYATARAMGSVRKLAANPVFCSFGCEAVGVEGEFFTDNRAAINWCSRMCQEAKMANK